MNALAMNRGLPGNRGLRPGGRRHRRKTAVIATLAVAGVLLLLVSALGRHGGNEPPVIDLAASNEWTTLSAAGVELLVHEVPGGWMVRSPGEDPELAMFYPDPGHQWNGAELPWEESELGGRPVRRQAVPRGWLIHPADPSGAVMDPFFVPDAEHDGVFEPETELIFAVNGFDFGRVIGKKS